MNSPNTGSIIESLDKDGHFISCIPPRHLRARLFQTVFLIGWLVFWYLILVPLTAWIFSGQGVASWPAILLAGIWLLMLVGEVLAVATLVTGFLPSFPETLWLYEHVLVYDPGYCVPKDRPEALLRSIIGRFRRPLQEYPKGRLSEPQFGISGAQSWLCIDCGNERIWLGRHLGECRASGTGVRSGAQH